MYDIQTIGAINKNTNARTHEIQVILGEETYDESTVKGKLDQIIAATNKTKVNKTVTPKETQQIITVNNENEVLSSVTVEPVINQNITVSATLDGKGHTITAETDNWYKTVTVEPINIVTQSIVPTNEQQIINAPQGACYTQFIVESVPTEISQIELTCSNKKRTIEPSQGKFFNRIIIEGESNLAPPFIRAGVTIGDVTGECRSWEQVSSLQRHDLLLSSSIKTFSFANGLPDLILLIYNSSNIGFYKFKDNTYTLINRFGSRALFSESNFVVNTTANTINAHNSGSYNCNMFYIYF